MLLVALALVMSCDFTITSTPNTQAYILCFTYTTMPWNTNNHCLKQQDSDLCLSGPQLFDVYTLSSLLLQKHSHLIQKTKIINIFHIVS